ncbi:hypothetical protein ACWF94_19385 [Streptomyces sp. NPDC055078]
MSAITELTRPRPAHPCHLCDTLKTALRARSAAGDIDGFIRVSDARTLHENTAHADTVRASIPDTPKRPRRTSENPTVRRTPAEVRAAREHVIAERATVTATYLGGTSLGDLAQTYGVTHTWLKATLTAWDIPVRDRTAAAATRTTPRRTP